jgi:hypothetical protein
LLTETEPDQQNSAAKPFYPLYTHCQRAAEKAPDVDDVQGSLTFALNAFMTSG